MKIPTRAQLHITAIVAEANAAPGDHPALTEERLLADLLERCVDLDMFRRLVQERDANGGHIDLWAGGM